ncbi:MAG: DUF1552 domain-containing protein [Mariniblastus sp.]
MNHKLQRRHFLKGLGGSALFLPHLDAMASTNAKKSIDSSVPKRMVCIGNNFGFVPQLFFPEKTGEQYDLPDLLKPLQDHKSDFTIFSHLDHGSNGQGGHSGIHAYLSGILSKNSKGFKERNISVDQKAAELNSAKTRFSSLQFSSSESKNNKLSWSNAGVALPSITNLNQIFDLLFQKSSPANKRNAKHQLDSQTSILDLVKSDADRLTKQVGKSDREKLDRYFSSIRSVEKQLDQTRLWIDHPKPTVDYQLPKEAANLNFSKRVPLYYDLIALALQTDSTRVITFGTGDIGSDGGGLGVTRGYHQLTHHGKVPGYIAELSIIESFLVKKFAGFLETLSSIEEPNGKTLLDNTITLFGSGMGNASSHSNKRLPLILAGGGFRHGSHISFENQNHRPPASNLFVSMLQQFGMETDRFGQSTGTLSGLESAQ